MDKKIQPSSKEKQEHMNKLQKESPKNIDGTVTPVVGTKKLLVFVNWVYRC